jgi:hypothetical protein
VPSRIWPSISTTISTTKKKKKFDLVSCPGFVTGHQVKKKFFFVVRCSDPRVAKSGPPHSGESLTSRVVVIVVVVVVTSQSARISSISSQYLYVCCCAPARADGAASGAAYH